MIVVSDTTPLISFLKINRLDILEKNIRKIIYIPENKIRGLHGKGFF